MTERLNGNGTRGRNITGRPCSETKTLPIDAVGQQDFIESTLGEGRTFAIVPIKATLKGAHLYIVLRDIERCVCLHMDQTRGIFVVLITTHHPHSTSPLSPSP